VTVVRYGGHPAYRCTVRVNNREYQTTEPSESVNAAKDKAALIAFSICRNFSANDGMYPTGFAHDGVIQGNPVPVGSGRHNRDNSLEYPSDSPSSRSGGSSPEYESRRPEYGSRHSATPSVRPSRQNAPSMVSPTYGRHMKESGRHSRRY
jgi:hypothetical protein